MANHESNNNILHCELPDWQDIQWNSNFVRVLQSTAFTKLSGWSGVNNNYNNNVACIAPAYQKLQRRWRTDYGRENRLGLNVWRNKNVLTVDVNTASEVLETTSLLSKFQTVGAVQQKARSAKWVLLIGLCSKSVLEVRRRREIWRDLMWQAKYVKYINYSLLHYQQPMSSVILDVLLLCLLFPCIAHFHFVIVLFFLLKFSGFL